MKFLLLIVTPYNDDQEAWLPHWIDAESHPEATEKAKRIAFSFYQHGKHPLHRYRFELFKTDSILPEEYSRVWREEFLSKKSEPT